jgi:hypothetical protein
MIIFNLDGVLANCEHRMHFIDAKCHENCKFSDKERYIVNTEKSICYSQKQIDNFIPDYKAFYDACDKDEPINEVIKIFTNCLEKHEVQIWSSRCESVRARTNTWFLMNTSIHIQPKCFINMKMRPIGNTDPEHILKEKWLDEIIAEGQKVDIVFESDAESIAMWKRRGVFVFDCRQG